MSFFLYFVFVYLCISCAAIILRIKLSIIIIRARRRLRHTHAVSRRRQRISSSMKFPMSLETATIATITCPLPLSSPHDTTRNQRNAAGSLSMHTGCDWKLIFYISISSHFRAVTSHSFPSSFTSLSLIPTGFQLGYYHLHPIRSRTDKH